MTAAIAEHARQFIHTLRCGAAFALFIMATPLLVLGAMIYPGPVDD